MDALRGEKRDNSFGSQNVLPHLPRCRIGKGIYRLEPFRPNAFRHMIGRQIGLHLIEAARARSEALAFTHPLVAVEVSSLKSTQRGTPSWFCR